MINNYTDTHPTTDASLDTRLRMLPEEFMGKAARGAGLGGPNDPIQPWQQDKANVMHINDTNRRTFADGRARASDAAKTSVGHYRLHDRQIGPLHPMDYEPDPSVGHRQVDRPEYTTKLFDDRFNRTTPSRAIKRDTHLPGQADADSGFRRTVTYSPALFTARPITRGVRNAEMRDVPSREVQASNMADLGKTDNPLMRVNPLHGMRQKKPLSGTEQMRTVPDPRAVTRDANAYTRALVATEDRDMMMQSVLNQFHDNENASAEDRKFFDYRGAAGGRGMAERLDGLPAESIGLGADIQPPPHDTMGSDYELVPTGRTRNSGVGSGLQGYHLGVPTHTPVRKPQWSTNSYKNTNMMDAQRVFGDGGTWGFATPIRASTNRGTREMVRSDNRRRVDGYERPGGLEGVADYMLNGVSTRGGDYRGGKIHSVHEGTRQPTSTRTDTASQRAAVGQFTGTKRDLPMDTMVQTRGGELWSKAALLTNIYAPRHHAHYDLAERTQAAAAGETEGDPFTKAGGFAVNRPVTHPGSAHHGDLATGRPPMQLAVR